MKFFKMWGFTNPSFLSWMNDRLPEMLWAALVIDAFGRDEALGEFQRILLFIRNHEQKEQFSDITLSGIAKVETNLRDELIGYIVEGPELSQVLSAMLLFDALPAREVWERHLISVEPDVELIMRSVGSVLWQHSLQTTSHWCRRSRRAAEGRRCRLVSGILARGGRPPIGENRDGVTTAADPRHDAVFGMAFYCLRILEEMLASILGRLGIRTI